jgi:hypothetical protein
METQRMEAAKALDLAGETVHREATNLERDESNPRHPSFCHGKQQPRPPPLIRKRRHPISSNKAPGFFDEKSDGEPEEEPPNPIPNIPLPSTAINSKYPSATPSKNRNPPQSTIGDEGSDQQREMFKQEATTHQGWRIYK